MKKAGKFLILLTIIFTLGTYVTPSLFNDNITVEAATKRKTVKEGMVTYTIYPINRYFTAKETKSIVNNYNKGKTAKAQTVSFILGLYTPVGFTFFLAGMSNDAIMKPFISAASKGKGVRMKYDYWLGNTSQSVYKIKNTKITVE